MSRVPGFYWIRIDGQAPEVAFWDRDAQGWVLSGTDEVLDDTPGRVVVLAGPLRPPIS